jgi:hypothetical protein
MMSWCYKEQVSKKEYKMLVYAVMQESYGSDNRDDVTEVYDLYANEDVAENLVKTLMSGKRSPYSPTYWVDPMEVKS